MSQEIIQINKYQRSNETRAVPVSSVHPSHICRGAGPSPRPFACDKDEHPADGDEAVFERGHGQDGELGTILQGKNSKKPPAPGGAAGTGLQEDRHTRVPKYPAATLNNEKQTWTKVHLNPPVGPSLYWGDVRSD